MDQSTVPEAWHIALLSAYGWGLLSSLTPCVYPLIPLTLALFGAKEGVPRLKSIILSLCYVLGIACTYTSLGMMAATSGGLIGSSLGKLSVVLPLSLFFLWFALYSLDFFQPAWISRIQTIAARIGGRGKRGAFTMGLVSGVVAAPCVGPALIVILGIASSAGQSLWGGTLLFVYALGFGSLFIALAAFSQLLKNIPRSGIWLFFPKFVVAVALFSVSLSLLKPFLPILNHIFTLFTPLLCISGIITGLLLGYFAERKKLRVLKALTAFFISPLVLFLFLSRAPSEIVWIDSLDKALVESTQTGKPIILDLYADWCAACVEFDQKTFSDARVIEALKDFVPVKLDFTIPDDESEALMEKYQVVGLPCILFLNSEGLEINSNLRVTGFLLPENFLPLLLESLKTHNSLND